MCRFFERQKNASRKKNRIYGTVKVLRFLYAYLIRTRNQKLNNLLREKREVLDEVRETLPYNKARHILERYDSQLAQERRQKESEEKRKAAEREGTSY